MQPRLTEHARGAGAIRGVTGNGALPALLAGNGILGIHRIGCGHRIGQSDVAPLVATIAPALADWCRRVKALDCVPAA